MQNKGIPEQLLTVELKMQDALIPSLASFGLPGK